MISKTVEECVHNKFEANVTVHRFEDTGKFMADVNIRCVDCDTPFQFLGVEAGLNMGGVAVDLTGLELRAAIAPEGSVLSPLDRFGALGVTRQ